MPRAIIAAVSFRLFAALALLAPGWVRAGPPERVTGKLMLISDEVTEGLRKYRQETDPSARLPW
jgi:hypothetical protein